MTKKENNTKNWFKDNVKAFLWALLIALGVRSFIAEPFHIPSGSMFPTLLVGDYLFVNKNAYGYSRYSLPFGLPLIPNRIFAEDPKRGDVVVFKVPSDNSTDFIKRVIGLPNDTIQVKEGRLYINGQIVERTFKDLHQVDTSNIIHYRYEEKLPNGVVHDILEISDEQYPMDNTEEFKVPEGHFFMMGDNRDQSKDSRFPDVSFVPRENLVGRASFIFYSNNGYSSFLSFWNWDKAIRKERIFTGIQP